MEVSVLASEAVTVEAEALAVGVWDEPAELSAAAMALDAALGDHLAGWLAARRLTGEPGKAQLVATLPPVSDGPRTKIIVAVGLGQRARFDANACRRYAAAAARQASALRVQRLALCLPLGETPAASATELAFAAAEGAALADYQYDAFKSSRQESPARLATLLAVLPPAESAEGSAVEAALAQGLAAADATNLVRDLVNGPPNQVTPAYLAETARRVASEEGLACEVLWRADLERLGAGGILAVNQGSAREPCLVRLSYRAAEPNSRTLAVVGKGITFDSGGLSLKPAESMATMQQDMAGAAAVIGFVRLAARLKLPCHVVGVFGATENLPSGTAYRPSDVIRLLNGRTVEVVNTDAEGRLVLGDCLAYVARERPDVIVDLATLTGANMVTFGHYAAAAIGNDERLAELMRQAGARSGERAWPLPLWPEYRRQMDSPVADLKNSGGRPGGSITAAAFLSEFVDDQPWVHLDIYGVAYNDGTQKVTPPYDPNRGATGFGPRLLREFVRLWIGT